MLKKFALIIAATTLTLSGCAKQSKVLDENSKKLDEIDRLIEAQQYQEAYQRAYEITSLLHPSKNSLATPDLKLLFCRASLTAFLALNSETIARSPILKHSLVRLPNNSDYISYSPLVTDVIATIEEMSTDKNLGLDEIQKSHILLATAYRFSSDTLEKSAQEYAKSIAAIENQIEHLTGENEKGSLFTKAIPFQEENLKSDKRYNQIGLCEVLLTLNRYSEALNLLNQLSQSNDLLFYEKQWLFLENQIAIVQDKIEEEFNRKKEGENLPHQQRAELLQKESEKKLNTFATYTPSEVALMQLEVELNFIKNGLIYRTICYYNLSQSQAYRQSLSIIEKFEPTIAKSLRKNLEKDPPFTQ